jgi:agmatinase
MSTKQKKISQFDPNAVGNLNANLYGLPFTTDEAGIVIVPVPWEVTVSYGGGTANGPKAIFDASFQVDLYDPAIKDAWKIGMAMDEIPSELEELGVKFRQKAAHYIEQFALGSTPENDPALGAIVEEINQVCQRMNSWVHDRVLHFFEKGKVVGLLGGDHSTPLGMIQAVGEKFGDFGILQIDAHADLRNAFEGFEFSHASIMYNALKNSKVKKLVQVGVRDFCEAEINFGRTSNGRVKTFFDRDIKHAQYNGESWASICDRIIQELPDKVYLSFDIDGLDPKLCPNTGTPVAGGFEVEQVLFLIERLTNSNKKIIAFDINEVSPGDDDWDANVGARLLYRIANLIGKSNKLD